MITCKNCTTELSTDAKYCPKCGQKAGEKLTMGLLFKDTVSNYLSFDSAFFRTIFPLISRPGKVARAFYEGQRAHYFHPAKFYLFISFLFFLIITLTDRAMESECPDYSPTKSEVTIKSDTIWDTQNDTFYVTKSYAINHGSSIDKPTTKTVSENINIEDLPSKDEQKAPKSLEENDPSAFSFSIDNWGFFNDTWVGRKSSIGFGNLIEKKGGDFLSVIVSQIPLTIFLSIPVFAFLFWLILFKLKIGYAGHFVFSLYFFAVCYILMMPLLIFGDYLDFEGIFILAGYALVVLFYLILAIRKMYLLSWFKSILTGLIQSALYLLLIVPMTVVVLFLVVFIWYS
ncbi:MAG: DUF3667 domain-containing protein [Flavobacteriales bacterium]|jgi:hypothetical protein|nr:DUF3667 domain-containing protein [Flavobacteriales bacterium]